MANNRREIDLIVRTQDESTRVFGLINKVLDVFSENADEVGAKAEKASGGVTGLGKAFGDLNRALRGQTAITTATANLDKATAAMQKLQERSQQLDKGLSDVKAKFGEAGVQAAQLAAKQGQLSERLKTQTATLEQNKTALTSSKDALAAVQKVQSEFDGAVNKSVGRLGTLQGSINRNIQIYERQAAAIDATDKPFQRQINSLAKTAERLAKFRAEMEQVNAALATQKANASVAAEVTQAYQAQVANVQKAFDTEKAAIASTNDMLKQNAREVAANAKLQTELAEDVNLSTTAFERNASEVTRSTEQLSKIEAEYRQIGAATEQLAAKTKGELLQALRLQQSTVDSLKNRHDLLRESLAKTGAEIDRTGVPTKELAEANARLREALQATKAEVAEQAAVYQRLKSTVATLPPELAASEKATEEFIRDINAGADALARIDKQVKDASSSFTRFEEGQRRAAPASREVAQAVKDEALGLKALFDNTQRLGGARGGVDGLAGAYRNLYGETRQALSYTQRLRSEVLALISTYGGFFAVIQVLSSTVEATQKIQAAQVRLKSVFGDTAKAGVEFDFIRREANHLGVDIGVLADEYSKFAAATQNTNLQGGETRRIFLAVAEAGRVQGLSLDDMTGIFKALQQIVSKGHVQLEELSGQLGDRLPGALQIMADGLGITVADLLKLTKQGQLSSDALSAFADNLELRYGKDLPDALKTTSAEIGRFKNASTQALLSFGQGGFIEGFNSLLQSLEKTFADPKFIDFIKEISAVLGEMLKILGLVIENWKLLTIAVEAFVAVKVAGVVVSLVGTLADLSVALLRGATAYRAITVAERDFATARVASTLTDTATAATAATRALGTVGTAIKGLGFGGGAALALFTGLVYEFYQIVTTAPDVTTALSDAQKAVDQVGIALDHSGGSIEKFRKQLQGLAADTVQASIQQLESVKSFQQVDVLQRLEQVVEAASDSRTMASPDDARAAQAIINAKLAFDQRNLSIRQYIDLLNKIRTESTNVNFDVKGFTTSLMHQAEASDNLNTEIDHLRDIYTVLTKTGPEAQDAFDRLNGSVGDVKDRTNDAKVAADSYAKALADMDAVLPNLNKNLKTMQQVAKLDDAFASAKKYVGSVQELLELTDKYNKNKATLLSGAADDTGSSFIDKLIQIESGGIANNKNPNSSATGLGQFIESTWLDLFRRYYPEQAANMSRDAILELRNDATTSRALLEKFSQENAQTLQKFGVDINNTSQYLAHFLGAGDAIKLLKSPAGTPVEGLISSASINANKSILAGKTNTEVIAWASKLIGIDKADLDVVTAINKQKADQAKKNKELADQQDKFHQGLKSDVDAQKAENAALGQSLVQREIAKALADKEAEAQKHKTTLTDAEKASIIAVTAAKYKSADITEQEKKADQAINDLLEHRKALQAEYDNARATGDQAKATDLKAEIAGVNTELVKATESAIALNKKLGGEDADRNIDKLRQTAAEVAKVKTEGNAANAMWTAFGQSIGDNLVTAFDDFAQAVANGENAWKALGTAIQKAAAQILIDLGHMIIKQAIFNALSGFFPGLVPGANGLFAHDGTGTGTIGSKSANRTANLPMSVWATAPRFHGGYDGLKPGEVPAVLNDTEAVLTKEDPFHPRNRAKMFAGMAGMMKQQLGLTIINTMDPADIVEAGLNTPRGDKVLVNRIGKNKESVKKTVNG